MFDGIPLDEFERRTSLRAETFGWTEVRLIVALRQLARIVDIRLMNDEYLRTLLGSIPLAGNAGRRPYEDCKVKRLRVDPAMLAVGQTFVEQKKLLSLQTDFFDVFSGTGAASGFAKKGAMIVLGETPDGDRAIAHYLPPLVEWHGDRHALLDGMHRAYTAMRVGTTIETIMVRFPKEPFPCVFGRWKDVKLVRAKPAKSRRFAGLRPEFFRDLKYVGIDG